MPRQGKIPAVRFNLKSHNPTEDKKVEILVYLIFRYKGKKLVYSTGEKVKPQYWDSSSNRAKYTKSHPEYADLNDRLNNLSQIAQAIFKDSNFGEITVKDFRNELHYRTGKKERPDSEKQRSVPLMEFIKQFIEERKAKPNAKRGTWKKLETVFNHLKEYSKDKGIKLTYESMDWNFKNDFENWLYSPPRNHAINNASKIFQVTKQFLYEAERHGYNPYTIFKQRGWGIQRVKVKKVVLSFAELKKLADLDLSQNERLDRVRDLFLIGAYSGLRYSDFTRIKPEHIIEEDGVEMIEIFTKKTDTEVVIPLMPELKTILEKYNYSSPKLISSQRMNEYLKELCQLAEINEGVAYKYSKAGKVVEEVIEKYKLISTHTARRSWATGFYQLGIPASELMLISAHSSEKQFFGYININKRQNAARLAKRIAFILSEPNVLRAVK